MSFIHYLFIGHFEHQGELVRFAKRSGDAAYKPVVARPVDMSSVQSLLRETQGQTAGDVTFPDDWQIWLEDGFLICDKHTKNNDAVRFLIRLIEKTGCEILDAMTHRCISLEEWSPLAPIAG